MGIIDFLAIWGAILSTIALTWNVVRDSRDKGIIRVTGFIGIIKSTATYGNHRGKDCLSISITNIGRRPVRINGWGAFLKKTGKKSYSSYIPLQPITLKESETHEEVSYDFSILDEKITGIFVSDSTGKLWKMKRFNFKNIINGYNKLKDSGKTSTN